MKMMKAARLHRIGDFRVEEAELPPVKGEELLVKVGACGICGSDIPRIYQLGTSKQKYPLTIGHEFSGTVVAVGENADPALVGQRGTVFPLIPCGSCEMCQVGKYVMCTDYDYMGSRRDGGFAEYVVVPSAWHFVMSENPETPMEALCMAEPTCVAQHAIRKSRLSAGEGVIIFGAGPIGILAARWAEIFGASSILLVDIDDEKVRFAQERGFQAVNSQRVEPERAFRELSGGAYADAVIEGTGFGSVLEECIACVRPMGRIVLLGNPIQENSAISRKAHSGILRKELQIFGAWNSNYAPFPINEWRYTVELLDSGRLQTADLITHRCRLEELPELCRKIRDHEVTVCKAVCTMEE